jgi:hypothetical protein
MWSIAVGNVGFASSLPSCFQQRPNQLYFFVALFGVIRSQGTVPLASREGDRSMFSADVFLVECDFPPKNGPVPSQPVNGYIRRYPVCEEQ